MKLYHYISILLLVLFMLWLTFFVVRETGVEQEEFSPIHVQTVQVVAEPGEVIDIADKFSTFLNTELPDGTWTEFTDRSGDVIRLSDFLLGLNSSLPATLDTFIIDGSWELYTCTNPAASFGSDIVVAMQLQTPMTDQEVRGEERAIRQSEQSLAQAFAPILFPEIDTDQIPTALNFEYLTIPGEFLVTRKADFLTTDSQSESSIVYSWIDKELVVGNSLECVERAISLMFDLSA